MNSIYLVAAASVLALILIAVMVMKKGKAAPEEPEDSTDNAMKLV